VTFHNQFQKTKCRPSYRDLIFLFFLQSIKTASRPHGTGSNALWSGGCWNPTGGTMEILRHGENGLTFTPEDAEGLADQIDRLRTDPDLYDRLAQSGRKTVLEKFTLELMVNEIEAFLMECFAGIPDQKIGAELAYS
jgi:hypothetical protein